MFLKRERPETYDFVMEKYLAVKKILHGITQKLLQDLAGTNTN